MTPGGPLTDEEVDELDAFLMSEEVPEDCMDVAMLDAFLTALAIGPNTPLPSRWIPAVWGEKEDEMAWASEEQAQRILGLILRHMNSLVVQFQSQPQDYEPLIYINKHEGEDVPVIDEWCMGFMRAVDLDPLAWKPLLDDADAQALLFPILLYGTETGWKEMERNPALAEQHQHFADSLADCVVAIHEYWLPLRLR